MVTHGYYRRPDVNGTVFMSDGWFRTGDYGFFDENGYLAFLGRIDDIYKINGENVSPKFLEDKLSECHEIEEVRVVGIPDVAHGAEGIAFIQLVHDTAENRNIVEEYTRNHLAKFQIPKYFIYIEGDEWPRTPTEKIKRSQLCKMAVTYIKKVERNLQDEESATENHGIPKGE